jgi:opacity protein-like surface antigen
MNKQQKAGVFMKLRALICLALSSLLLIAGCTQSSNGTDTSEIHNSVQTDRSNAESRSDKSAADQNDVKDHSSTASTPKLGSLNQTLQAIQKQLSDQKQLSLPSDVPIEVGKYHSAVVNEQASGYSVTFKQTNTPAAVNDPSLAHAKTIAAIRARTFQNKNDAAKQISHNTFSASDGKAVDLGHGITGYADAGAGTAGISWNEGRWTLASLSPTSNAEEGVDLARELVAYLEQHSLPIPHQYGTVQVYTDKRQSSVRWQSGTTIFELTGAKTPLTLIKIACSIKAFDE